MNAKNLYPILAKERTDMGLTLAEKLINSHLIEGTMEAGREIAIRNNYFIPMTHFHENFQKFWANN